VANPSWVTCCRNTTRLSPHEMGPLNPQERTSARGAWRMALCAICCREQVQQSASHDAPKQTNDSQASITVWSHENRDPTDIAIKKVIINVATPDHSAWTCNQSLRVGKAPVAERRGGLDCRILSLWFKVLYINPNTLRAVSYDHCLA